VKIKDFLRRKAIIEDLQAVTKEAVLEEMAAALSDRAGKRAQMVSVLMAREELGSTGIGDGIAIPHGKIPELDELIVSCGRSKKGIDFNARDGKPVHFFFLLLAPENSAGQHLKVLAMISRLSRNKVFRKKLMEAGSTTELYELIVEKDDRDLT